LLKAALDGDDSLRAGHLELEVGVVGDGHKLGEAQPIKEGVVDTEEVDDLKGERLLAEVVWLAEGDVELDVPMGHDLHMLPYLLWKSRSGPVPGDCSLGT